MKWCVILLVFLCSFCGLGQTAQEQLLAVKSRLDSIQKFEAETTLHVDISFISMPDKTAQVTFEKGEDIVVASEDFVLIPKRGMDLSFSELFEHPFLAVDRGKVAGGPDSLQAISLLPANNKAEFSVANLHVDTFHNRIIWAEINTKKDGTYALSLSYEDEQAILPYQLDIAFEMDRIRIPLNFAGRDVSIDRKKMRKTDKKTGNIVLHFRYSTIEKTQ